MTTFAEAAADVDEEAIATWDEATGVDDTLLTRPVDTGADAAPVPVPVAFPESMPKSSSSPSPLSSPSSPS